MWRQIRCWWRGHRWFEVCRHTWEPGEPPTQGFSAACESDTAPPGAVGYIVEKCCVCGKIRTTWLKPE